MSFDEKIVILQIIKEKYNFRKKTQMALLARTRTYRARQASDVLGKQR